jgi:isoquinoline 1-oxidoreductase subunit alpha
MTINLSVNGKAVTFDGDPETPLLWVLRDELKLTGTKYGCGAAACGACTVHIDGVAQRACVTLMDAVASKEITTIEAVGGKIGDAVKAAWIKHDVAQCGYCQSGQVMAAAGLLSQIPWPSDDDINKAMDGNICRCCTYQRIRAAIHDAASTLKTNAG